MQTAIYNADSKLIKSAFFCRKQQGWAIYILTVPLTFNYGFANHVFG